VVVTLAFVAYTVMAVLGASGPAAIVLGGGLALSSTAVAMQARPRRPPAMPPCVMPGWQQHAIFDGLHLASA